MATRSRARVGVFVAWGVGAAAVAGCNFLVGAGDYAVDQDAGADATTSESGGGDDSGQASDRGAGEAGDPNRRSDAGADASGSSEAQAGDGAPNEADADAASNAGSDGAGSDADSGEAGPVVVCGQDLPDAQADAGTDFQKLVNACVLAVSCDPFFFPISVSDCISRNALAATGALSCLATITDCAGFYRCYGARSPTPTECPSSTTPGSCDTVNNVARDCFTAAVINCAARGGTCRTFVDSAGRSHADCAIVDPCTVPDGGGLECSNNNLYGCVANADASAGVGYGRACTGATCATTASGGTDCYFNGTGACPDAGSTSCNGSALQVCNAIGQSLSYDCTRAGGRCAADDAGNAGCVSPGCSLSSPCTESCNINSTMTVCVGGAPLTIDCSKYGFSSCLSGGPGTSCFL